jgi:serine/tyrosine/threonine adenylyltransferase
LDRFMCMPLTLESTYSDLGPAFYESTNAEKFPNPKIFYWNGKLADTLHLPESFTHDAERMAQFFSGQQLSPSVKPLAMAYAGHQFGHFNPQLGDGRALLLGEWVHPDTTKRFDIHLKGSGKTRFSRGGDGRCALGPALRELIMSEALASFGIPTTRTLAVLTTGENILRPQKTWSHLSNHHSNYSDTPGAIVVRVAQSHVRIGTFEFFASRRLTSQVQSLTQYVMRRLYPHISQEEPIEAMCGFFESFAKRYINLTIEWMRVGFIHGVLNTDNVVVSGETIDFGPCAMMNGFDWHRTYSSIDSSGRYAYGNQPSITLWNLQRLADCLATGFCPNKTRVSEITSFEQLQADPLCRRLYDIIERMGPYLEESMAVMWCKKLGFNSTDARSKDLVERLLKTMQDKKMDFTNTFAQLSDLLKMSHDAGAESIGRRQRVLDGQLATDWMVCLESDQIGSSYQHALAMMKKNNPLSIPRNRAVEHAIASAVVDGDLEPLSSLLGQFDGASAPGQSTDQDTTDFDGYQTFCGT